MVSGRCRVGIGLGLGSVSGRCWVELGRESGVGNRELGLGRCPLVVRGYGLGVACRV